MPHDSTPHDRHDPILVVSLAAGDLAGTDRDRATNLIRECPECARLHDDLIAIARATAALPAAVSPRDFRITPEQAERLRPTGWRRFVAAFGAPRFSRQLGVGMATLGLAGLLLSALPPLQFGGSAGAAPAAGASTEDQRFSAQGPQSYTGSSPIRAPIVEGAAPSASTHFDALTSAAASAAAASAAPAASIGKAYGDGNGVAVAGGAQPSATRETAADTSERTLAGTAPDSDSRASLLVIASAILLIAGIALLLARRVAGANTAR
jgi:hypothetical protein